MKRNYKKECKNTE